MKDKEEIALFRYALIRPLVEKGITKEESNCLLKGILNYQGAKKMRVLATNNRHRITCLPSSLIFDHGVKNRQQLAHTSNKSDFWRLSSFKQAIIELLDHGIKPGSDNGAHIKGTADMSPSAPNAILKVPVLQICKSEKFSILQICRTGTNTTIWQMLGVFRVGTNATP